MSTIKNNEEIKRIAVLGLDGLSRIYLNKLFKNNVIPYTKEIVENAKIKVDLYCFPPVTPVSWPSIMTGVNPGKHGIYDFFVYEKGKTRWANTFDLEHPRIHEMLSFLGLKSLVINPVPSYPIIPVKNAMIFSIGFFTPKRVCYPKGCEKYLSIFNGIHSEIKKPKEIFEKAYLFVEKYIELIEKLLSKYEYHLLWFNLNYPDNIFHKSNVGGFSDILDKKVYEDEIRIFRKIDQLIKELDKNFDNIVIVSDHGFHRYRYRISINTILYRAGFIKTSSHGLIEERDKIWIKKQEKGKVLLLKPGIIVKIARIPIIGDILRKTKRFLENKMNVKIQVQYEDIDPLGSIAFMITKYSYGIIVNDQSRIEELINILKKIEGIKDVWKRHEIFDGEYLERLPAIYVYPDFDQGYDVLGSKITDQVIVKVNTIDHHPHGIFIMKNWLNNQVNEYKVLPNTVVTPLIMTYMGLPLSDRTDNLDLISKLAQRRIKTTDMYLKRWNTIKRIEKIKLKA